MAHHPGSNGADAPIPGAALRNIVYSLCRAGGSRIMSQ
jgi:hypothetical protein